MNIQPLEPIEVINQRLVDYFGRFENGQANFRLVWSEDFLEKRLIYSTKEGFDLLTPIISEDKKCSYIDNRYLLVRLVPVPEVNQPDLCGAKTSYEPVWTFEDGNGNPLPPKWEAIKVLIELIDESMYNAFKQQVKYKQDEKEGNTLDAIKHRVSIISEQLFGNETAVGDSLSLDSAVGYGTRQRKDWLN